MINFKQIFKCISDKAIYCGIGFFIGCIVSNYLTSRHYSGTLAFIAFFVLLITVLGRVFRKKIEDKL